MRSPVAVRPARPEDLDVLVALGLAARAESLLGPQLCTDDGERLRHQMGALAAEPGARALVGTLDGEVCGLMLARVSGPNLFTDEVSVAIEAVYVAEGARRRGVGHALLGAVADEAQRVGATEVIAVPLPGARGMQRFLARLGFAPAAAHRVASTETLQRRLAGEAAVGARRAPVARGARTGIDDLIARRRRFRGTRGDAASTAVTVVADPAPVGRVTGAVPAAAGQASGPGRTSISMQVSRAVQIRRPRRSSTTTS